jgi:hypothetical protein
MSPTECTTGGGPAWCWADNSEDAVTVNFACDNATCAAGKGPWDTPRPATATATGHLGNQVREEGVDRCATCGCKYWEHDVCIDCTEVGHEPVPADGPSSPGALLRRCPLAWWPDRHVRRLRPRRRHEHE